MTPFVERVCEGMRRRGLSLRELCRAAELDPSFFSKVLGGKRSPPSSEAVLRRLSELLGLDAAELIVAAGRIPEEWRALWNDRALFEHMHSLATGTSLRKPPAPRSAAPILAKRQEMAEELL